VRLFGTDGVRGVANAPGLTAEVALGLGRAAVRFALERGAVAKPRVLVGRDTRRSGPLLEDALCAGIASAGGLALRAGVLPTPGVAVLVRERGLDCGAVVSASHNPFGDNGIKLFGADGFKLTDADEDRLEALMQTGDLPTGVDVGESAPAADAADEYARWLVARFGGDFGRPRVLVDCGHGAATAVAPAVFALLRVDADAINTAPDGTNINRNCGSTHLEPLAAGVRTGGYDLGVAFDGDADRMLAVDASGRAVDGDQIIAILARDLQGRGELPGDRVIVTSMTNLGFHRAMGKLGVEAVVTDVGDRHVLAAMREHGVALGGEQSGHVIAFPHQTTGDGIATALLLLGALARSGSGLAEAAALVQRFPQTLVNVPADRTRLAGATALWRVVEQENATLARSGAGRIVLRASGTEPLVRVMVEHESADEVTRLCASIVTLVERELGV